MQAAILALRYQHLSFRQTVRIFPQVQHTVKKSCLKYQRNNTALPGLCLGGHKQNPELHQLLKFSSLSLLGELQSSVLLLSQSFPKDQRSRHPWFQAPTLLQLRAPQMHPHCDNEHSALLTCAVPQLTPGAGWLTAHAPRAQLPITAYPLQNTALSAELQA